MKHNTTLEFKPLLAPNEQPAPSQLTDDNYLVSTKLDGIRCIFKDGQMLSRSLKPIRNKQLYIMFEPLIDCSRENNWIIDGELYCHGMSFQDITSIVMTEDKIIPENFKFYVFDMIIENNYNEPFEDRYQNYINELPDYFLNNAIHIDDLDKDMIKFYRERVHCVEQIELDGLKELRTYFSEAREQGYEGLMIRSLNGKYKFGRATIKENIIYKMKPYVTTDAEIIDVLQATKVREEAEKKINELGRSVTSKKKGDRLLIEKASDFVVLYEGKEVKVTIALTDKEKKEIWKNRRNYIGKIIEYKYLECGMKDKPRHPVFLRFIHPESK